MPLQKTLLAYVSICLVSADLFGQDLPPIVRLESGQIRGTDAKASEIEVFKGIPYAAPPVGELRWHPPQPVEAWEGVRDCVKFGSRSLQRKLFNAGQSEDCLYLNVWRPRETEEIDTGLPVMVWIHGGGFTQGSGHEASYDGTALAKKGVIVVTINYRLGALGFFAHPELSAESPHGSSGNYAILDQVAALEWVRDNIAAFGGNPNNVTIFGESAGGTSVYLLLATPLSQGLFHRAILESPWLDPVIFRSLKNKTNNGPAAETDGEREAQKLVGESDVEPLEALRALPAKDLLQKMNQRWPVVTDGWVFPKPPRDIFAAGEQHPVPVIVGTNRDEGTMFAPRDPFGSMENYEAAMAERFGDWSDEIVEFYGAESKKDLRQVAVRQISDAWFIQPAREFARAMDSQGSQVWMYHFTKPVWGILGAAHAAEIRYVFGSLDKPDAEDAQLSETFMNCWVQFAKQGNPNGEGLPDWPNFTIDGDDHLIMDADIQVDSKLRCEACDLIDKILAERKPEALAP